MLTAPAVSTQLVCLLAYPIFRATGKYAWDWQTRTVTQLNLPSPTAQGAWLTFCAQGTFASLLMGVVSLPIREEFDR